MKRLQLDELAPMEFTEEPGPFDHPGWGFEIRYDGYRVLASTGPGARIRTRHGADATGSYQEVVRSLELLEPGFVQDGEVAVLDDLGRSDYEQLQRRGQGRGARQGVPLVVYCAFDMLVHRGVDVRGWPLQERKDRARGATRKAAAIDSLRAARGRPGYVAPLVER